MEKNKFVIWNKLYSNGDVAALVVASLVLVILVFAIVICAKKPAMQFWTDQLLNNVYLSIISFPHFLFVSSCNKSVFP